MTWGEDSDFNTRVIVSEEDFNVSFTEEVLYLYRIRSNFADRSPENKQCGKFAGWDPIKRLDNKPVQGWEFEPEIIWSYDTHQRKDHKVNGNKLIKPNP
jgi:hypothetical protein